MRLRNTVCLCAIGAILAGCGTKPIQPSDKHIQQPTSPSSAATGIPQTIKRGIVLPPPKPVTKAETYSVVVTNVSVQEILFALARDAKINLDIHPGIQGVVTLNALNQTLPQILTRIARQVDMRYELDNGNLIVMPDTPYLHHYKIDYVNMTRDTEGAMANATQVGSGTSAAGATGAGGNNSSLSIKNTSKNRFWETLIQNIKDILRETDKEIVVGRRAAAGQQAEVAEGDTSKPKAAPAQTSSSASGRGTAESDFRDYQTLLAASVIANPENGLITVRATGKQHEKIQEFVDQIMTNARRQVMIEATIVEVRLNDNYKQGINWSLLQRNNTGFQLRQAATAGLPSANAANLFTLDYLNPTSRLGNLTVAVSLLESFGTVKVLSSPKLSVMNNQTAILRVVDNQVYFIVNSTTATCSPAPCTPITTYTTTVNTVPIGFTMSVTPQINESDTVLLNIRPSITRFLANIPDPTPNLAFTNAIPQTSTREMESILKIENNQIAVLGGLMEDRIDNFTDAVPGVSKVPLAGELFKHRNDTSTKTELVIFLRPMVIKDASIVGDFSAYRDMLPDQDFFKEPDSGKH
ncbi:MAG: pilus (MSHA type) biogenesis protein MshL [Gallionellales bacterium GWE2_58_10]|nr:MAG: pilus (MSHA type) biogenesis protein MshL [Gallionellales bacterium GWE2_58_10]